GRAAVRLPARRLNRGRDRVHLARPRPPFGRQRLLPRLPGDPGRDPAVLDRVHPDQPGRRRALRLRQSGDPLPMSAVTAPLASAGAETVRSPWREFWRRFRRQKVGVIAGLFLVALVLMAILAPWIAPYDLATPDYERVLEGPSWAHLAGTDAYGRDILSR